MKMKITRLAVAAMALALSQASFASFQATLPEFKSKEELTKIRQSQEEVEALVKGRDSFYTGKFYETTGEGYLFKYRNYDPELNRWTTVDVSGFPDGANNNIYPRNPVTSYDYQGLQEKTIRDGEWWFSVNYKLTYTKTTAPTLVGGPWLTGITGISGVPAGYDLRIDTASLSDITSKTNADGSVTWTGKMNAVVHLDVTFGIKVGPITLGPGYEDSVSIYSNWSVTAE